MNWTMQDDYLNWNGIISNEDEKINIAKKVAEKVKDGEVIGFGSGSTSFLTIKEIAKKIKNENLKIKAIPTSYETKLLCSALEIPTVSIIEKKPDWCFDGTDEIDENNWLIKGRGAAMFKEKINILNSPKVYILADESKFVKKLGDKFKIPVECYPETINYIKQELYKLGATECELDKQGRFLIAGKLREVAKLDKDVTIIGAGTRIEIWDKAKWEEHNSEENLSIEEIEQNMEDLGI